MFSISSANVTRPPRSARPREVGRRGRAQGSLVGGPSGVPARWGALPVSRDSLHRAAAELWTPGSDTVPPPGCWGFGGGAGGAAQSQGALRASPRGRDWSQGSEALAWGTRNSVHLPVSGSSFVQVPPLGFVCPLLMMRFGSPRSDARSHGADHGARTSATLLLVTPTDHLTRGLRLPRFAPQKFFFPLCN